MAYITNNSIEEDGKDVNGYEEHVKNALIAEITNDPLNYGYSGMTDAQIAERLMAPQITTGTREDYIPVDPEDPETLYEKTTTEYVVSEKQPRYCEIVSGLAYASNAITEEDITNLNI